MQTVIPLTPGGVFHIFDRGVNRGNIFFKEQNYRHFLDLYGMHIIPVADTYAYCLLRNHFHILVRIKTDPPLGIRSISKAFNNFLTAYAKGINRAYERTGPLFQHHFSRKLVVSRQYMKLLVAYIHRNPCKHGFVQDLRDWPFSSYHELASKAHTSLARSTVLGWFGGASGFRRGHADNFTEDALPTIIGNDMD